MKKALLLACIGMLSIQQIQSSSNLPAGSYLQSCSNCVMEGTKLNCTCKKIYGRRNNTSINASQCASGSITNTNGNLTCTPIMQGSYLESCHNCTIQGSLLTCSCWQENYHINKTIDISKCISGTVANELSGLTCETIAQLKPKLDVAAQRSLAF